MIYYLSSAINRLYICSAIMSHAWEPLVKGPHLALNENWSRVLKSYLLQILDYVFPKLPICVGQNIMNSERPANSMPVTELLRVQFIQGLHESENSDILRFAWRPRMLFKIGLSIRTLLMCNMSIKSIVSHGRRSRILPWLPRSLLISLRVPSISNSKSMESVTKAMCPTSTAYSNKSILVYLDQVLNHSKKIAEYPVQFCWSFYMAVKALAAERFVKIYSIRQLQAWRRYTALPLYIMIRFPGISGCVGIFSACCLDRLWCVNNCSLVIPRAYLILIWKKLCGKWRCLRAAFSEWISIALLLMLVFDTVNSG